MNGLTIASTAIRTDADGRYCLNDLHRASGGEKRHGPSYWLANAQSRALVDELATTGIPVVTAEGAVGGTYVAKELVYAYAMWISPAFHLKVIRAYDAMVSAPAPAPTTSDLLNDPAAMRGLLLGYTEKVMALQGRVEKLEPKADALDRIATGTDGSFCLTDAAKAMQMQPRHFTAWLQKLGWIHRRPMGTGWLGYQVKIAAGMLEHKVTTGEKTDGTEWASTQVRVTAKGMAKLAELASTDRAAA